MKLLSVQLARTIWAFDVSEINPRGKNIFSDLVPTLIETYDFKKSPQEGGDFSQGMVFTLGTFTNRNHDRVQVGLTIWSDGIAADTYSSTRDSDEFLDGALKILPELGYAFDPAMIRRKTYNSQIFVRCQKNLSALNPRLDAFARKISIAVGQETLFGCAAVEFWPDPAQAFKPVNFSFQKRQGDALASDRYWSQAGLPTDKHLELLEELESILS
jgi:hypothetical protein